MCAVNTKKKQKWTKTVSVRYGICCSSRSASSIQCAVLLFLSSTYCSRIDIRCLFATTKRSKFSSFRKFRTLASCRRQIRMDWHEINIRQPFQYRLSDVPNNNRSRERKKNSFPLQFGCCCAQQNCIRFALFGSWQAISTSFFSPSACFIQSIWMHLVDAGMLLSRK